MRFRGAMALLCLSAMLSAHSPVRAGPETAKATSLARRASAAKLVDRGIQFYYEGRYQKALKLLTQALQIKTLHETRRIGAMQYLAFCHVALGEPTKAQTLFEQLLESRPDFQLPAGTAPKIVKIFEEVQATMAPLAPPDPTRIVHRPPADAEAGKALPIAARAEHLPPEGRLAAYYRTAAGARYNRLDLQQQADGRFAATIPPPLEGSAEQLYYYLEALGADGVRLAQVGNADEPLAIPYRVVAPPPPPPEEDAGTSTWWIWPVAGAVLLGAGLALGLTLAEDSKPRGQALIRFTLGD